MFCFSASTFERLASRLRRRCRKLPSADPYALLSSGPAGCRPAATRPSSTHRAVVAGAVDAEHSPVGRRVNGVGHDVGLRRGIGVTPARTVTSRTSDFRAAAQCMGWEAAEASMSKTIHSTQIVTPFGSGHVPEDHGHRRPRWKNPGSGGQVGHRADGRAIRRDDCGSGHLGVEPELCVGAETLAAKPAFNSDEAPRVLRPRRGAVLRQRDILRMVGSFEWLPHRPVIAGGAADAEPLAERCEGCRSSTASASLNRRAWHRAVGAKHAAVARLGLQPLAASLAVIEELAGVGGHPLGGGVAALRAGDGGLLNHTPANRTSVANGISQR